MSKHNYSQYSNKKNISNNEATAKHESNVNRKPEPVVVPVEEKVELVKETVETVTLPETVEGRVVKCAKLNVRENATVDSGIVCVLDAMSEIEIDVNRSTTNWCYVYSATGAEGYCMREYIEAHM